MRIVPARLYTFHIKGATCEIVVINDLYIAGSDCFWFFTKFNMLVALFIAALCIIPLSSSNPAINGEARPQVLHINTANMPNSYDFHYEASDGSSRTEEGAILNPGTDQAALDVLGTVRYYDKNGQLYEMSYKAGKRGYRTIIRKVRE